MAFGASFPVLALVVLALLGVEHASASHATFTQIERTKDGCQGHPIPDVENPVKIYQNNFCYRSWTGSWNDDDAISYKFTGTTVSVYTGMYCDETKVISNVAAGNGACIKETEDEDDPYYIHVIESNLASNGYDLEEGIVSGTCKYGSFDNKFYQTRHFGKCYPADNERTYHRTILGTDVYTIAKIFVPQGSGPSTPAYCQGNYTLQAMPLSQCFSVDDTPNPDYYVSLHSKIGALDFYMQQYEDSDATHFPFPNVTETPFSPSPDPEKLWVRKKTFLDTACEDDSSGEYEQIYRVGVCYRVPEQELSEGFMRDQAGELAFYFWNDTDCTSDWSTPTKSESIIYEWPLHADMDMACSPLYERVAVNTLESESFNATDHNIALLWLVFPNSNQCDAADTSGFKFYLYSLDKCLVDETDDENEENKSSFMFVYSSSTAALRLDYDTDDCTGPVKETNEYRYDQCMPIGSSLSAMNLNPANAANRLLELFPETSPDDFPLTPTAAPVDMQWSKIRLYNNSECADDGFAGDSNWLGENQKCYNNAVGSVIYTETGFRVYSHQHCEDQDLDHIVSYSDLGGLPTCVKDPTVGSPFYFKIVDSAVEPNTYNVTGDFVTARGCKDDTANFVYEEGFFGQCSQLYSNNGSTFHMFMSYDDDDHQYYHYLMEKAYHESGCSGNYTMYMTPIDGTCYAKHENEFDGNYYTSAPTSGALDAFMNQFQTSNMEAFPFLNQTYPPHVPDLKPSEPKQWLHFKSFRHEHCEDQQAPDFEQLFPVGTCFQLPDDEGILGMLTTAFVNESDGLNMYR